MAGLKVAQISSGGASFPAGQYYIGRIYTRRSANAANIGAVCTGIYFGSEMSTEGVSNYWGSASNVGVPIDRRIGAFSTTLNGTTTGIMSMPGSINSSAMTNTAASLLRIPVIWFGSRSA